jgi:hypothetical protein
MPEIREPTAGRTSHELQRLYEQHALAAMRAVALLRKGGVFSPQFKDADKAAGKAWRGIRMILGDANSYWL